MSVRITVTKLSGGRIGVNVSKPENNHRSMTHAYDSEQDAREALVEMGLPDDALIFYFQQLFPRIARDEQLAFPEMKVQKQELWRRGFRFADDGSRHATNPKRRKYRSAL